MKWIAKKVVRHEFFINGQPIMGYHCPKCDTYLWTAKATDMKYCSKCGQKLKWR